MDPMTEDEYMRMMQLGSENQALQAQIAQAQALSGRPEMRSAGRITKAPHWMEYLGSMANSRAVNNSQDKMRKNQDLQNQMFMAMLLKSQQPQAPVTGEPAAGNGFQPPRQRSPYEFGP